jgi:hypothetical protein
VSRIDIAVAALSTDWKNYENLMEKELLERDIIAAKFFCVKFRIGGTVLKIYYKFFHCCKISFRCLLVRHILKRKTWKSPYLDIGFLEVAKT